MTRIKVTYESSTGSRSTNEEFAESLYPFRKLGSTEKILRNAIEHGKGTDKNILQDLYRWLVISNFARLNGKGGKAAMQELNTLYPPCNTLPDFEILSGKFNTCGAILQNYRSHSRNEPGYNRLMSIVLGLVAAGVAPPKIEGPAGLEEPFEETPIPPQDAYDDLV